MLQRKLCNVRIYTNTLNKNFLYAFNFDIIIVPFKHLTRKMATARGNILVEITCEGADEIMYKEVRLSLFGVAVDDLPVMIYNLCSSN